MSLQILETRRARAILDRMAWQLYELNYEAPAINLLGVSVRGQYLAQLLQTELGRISNKAIHLGAADATDWKADLQLSADAPLVLVDDVLYTGTTLFKTLLQVADDAPYSQLQVCVLVDRGHRTRPISPDVVGLELATTLQEYVLVKVDPATGSIAAFLD